MDIFGRNKLHVQCFTKNRCAFRTNRHHAPLAIAKLSCNRRDRSNPEWVEIVASLVSRVFIGHKSPKARGFFIDDVNNHFVNADVFMESKNECLLNSSNGAPAVGGVLIPYSNVVSHMDTLLVDSCSVQMQNPVHTTVEWILDNLFEIHDRSCRANVFFDPDTGEKVLLDFDTFRSKREFCQGRIFPQIIRPSFLDTSFHHTKIVSRQKARINDWVYCSLLRRGRSMMMSALTNFEEKKVAFDDLLKKDQWFRSVLPKVLDRKLNCSRSNTKSQGACFVREDLYINSFDQSCLPDRCIGKGRQWMAICVIQEVIFRRLYGLMIGMRKTYAELCPKK